LTHLNTGRGSNKFETRKHLIIVGLPKINLGAAKLTHAALTTGVEFNDFYSHNSKAELIQELGRLRHGRRLNEKLTCTIISNDDLTFLENLGFNIVQESYENFING
jgi:HKD family nuclease